MSNKIFLNDLRSTFNVRTIAMEFDQITAILGAFCEDQVVGKHFQWVVRHENGEFWLVTGGHAGQGWKGVCVGSFAQKIESEEQIINWCSDLTESVLNCVKEYGLI